jgi:ribosomal protein S13
MAYHPPMLTDKRIKELQNELDDLYKDQVDADSQHKRDIDAAKNSGDWRGMRKKNRDYVRENNRRAHRYDEIFDELDA